MPEGFQQPNDVGSSPLTAPQRLRSMRSIFEANHTSILSRYISWYTIVPMSGNLAIYRCTRRMLESLQIRFKLRKGIGALTKSTPYGRFWPITVGYTPFPCGI